MATPLFFGKRSISHALLLRSVFIWVFGFMCFYWLSDIKQNGTDTHNRWLNTTLSVPVLHSGAGTQGRIDVLQTQCIMAGLVSCGSVIVWNEDILLYWQRRACLLDTSAQMEEWCLWLTQLGHFPPKWRHFFTKMIQVWHFYPLQISLQLPETVQIYSCTFIYLFF